MKRKILFVDEEPNIQRALRRMFHPMREAWDMAFAGSGREAMAALAAENFDIIVCDLQMPDMSGIDLLSHVKSAYPQMARIIFSGDSRLQTSLQTVRLAHQYIAKPVNTEQLASTIKRASMLKGLLDDASLRRRIASLETLPTLPDLYSRIVASLEDPQGAVEEAGAIIAQDITMTAKILQLVNSAFFGLAREVTSPSEAVVYLGLDIIRALVLTIGIFSQLDGKALPPALLRDLYDHSIRAGSLARDVALSADISRRQADSAFTAGLLHDLGKLVMACDESRQHIAWLRETVKNGSQIPPEQEQAIHGFDHGRIGAYLIGLWGLPSDIVEAVAFHHAPGACQSVAFDTLGAVHVANALHHQVQRGRVDASSAPTVDWAYLKATGTADHWDGWLEMANRRGSNP